MRSSLIRETRAGLSAGVGRGRGGSIGPTMMLGRKGSGVVAGTTAVTVSTRPRVWRGSRWVWVVVVVVMALARLGRLETTVISQPARSVVLVGGAGAEVGAGIGAAAT